MLASFLMFLSMILPALLAIKLTGIITDAFEARDNRRGQVADAENPVFHAPQLTQARQPDHVS
jgi:hypothetical protein